MRNRQGVKISLGRLHLARDAVAYLNSKRADPSLLSWAASIAGIKEPGRMARFARRKGMGLELALDPAFQPPHLQPEDLNHAELEKHSLEIVQTARRLAQLNPEAVPDEMWVGWVLSMLLHCRPRIPKLQCCPRPGCPRFFLVEHGEVACSPRHAARVRFDRFIENLKKSGGYEAYLEKKRLREKQRRRKKRPRRKSRRSSRP